MIRFKFIAFGIASALFLNSCNKVLEPVTFLIEQKDNATVSEQEEFEINIKSLTFDTAKNANNAPYPRRLMLTGNGSKANVLDEASFLNSSFPESLSNISYLVGIGDEISFLQLNEFKTGILKWPDIPKETEYLLGAGDELTFIQSNDSKLNNSVAFSGNGQMISEREGDKLIQTMGVIGSNGNILLYGLGNILAANRTLDSVRTEIRNILIRNGLAPNFQLEISNFNSQKIFVSNNQEESRIYTLNNIPITLKQVALEAGLSSSNENFAIVNLTRNDQKFRFTAGQLFDSKTPSITLQDKDQIKIQIANKISTPIKSFVGSRGNILLDGVGSISAFDRTLDDIYEEIRNILIKQGTEPSFQLMLTKFSSKKAYLINKSKESSIILLTDSKITLRELILKNKIPSPNSLSIVTLKRNGRAYRMTEDQILDPKTQDIQIINEDIIELKNLHYKLGQVFALSGTGHTKVVPIDPSKRETLADILFVEGGALSNSNAKRSEVYLLRGKNPSIAYHLDAQNVSRILVAASTELRPNDIVYVADRPIVSFTRTLSEILPLRILLRDIQNDNIP